MPVSKLLKRLVIGTPLERPLRKLATRLRPSSAGRRSTSEWGLRQARDQRDLDVLLPRLISVQTVCIDVGANRGAFLEQFVQIAGGARHYAFEPIPHFARDLMSRFPGVCVTQAAVSDAAGETTFNFVPGLPDWSGLKTQDYPSNVQVEKIPVKLVRLDDVIPLEAKVGFIKIDVEGAEMGVFRGSRELIRRCRPTILFEHAQVHTAEYGTTPEMVHDFLCGECGLKLYSLSGAGPHSRDEFGKIYRRSHRDNYDRDGETNFLASAADIAALRRG